MNKPVTEIFNEVMSEIPEKCFLGDKPHLCHKKEEGAMKFPGGVHLGVYEYYPR